MFITILKTKPTIALCLQLLIIVVILFFLKYKIFPLLLVCVLLARFFSNYKFYFLAMANIVNWATSDYLLSYNFLAILKKFPNIANIPTPIARITCMFCACTI